MTDWLAWATPILATLTAALQAGHLGLHLDLSWLVLISAIATAVVGFYVVIQKRPAEDTQPAKPVQPVPPKTK